VNLETLQVTALILSIVLYLALITLIVMAIPAFRELRKWLKGSEELRSLVRTLTPTVTNAAENISYLSAAFRSDADELGQTVRRATTSANEIIDSARDRAAEINGFLEVVQEEAESTFLNTASLLRGVRAGRSKVGRDVDESSERRRLG
jgi:biopolymer transport protein ExbB/TolQ